MAEPDLLTRPAPEPDRVIAYGSDPEQVADVWQPGTPTSRPTVLLVHGGFWRPAYDRLHTRPMAAALRGRGWPVLSLEYRRVPGDPDTTHADVRRALEVLPGLVGASDLIVAGHSAGGHLALWAATVCPPESLRATVALAPVADLRLAEREGLSGGAVPEFLGVAAEERADLDPTRLPSPVTPVGIVHGTADEDVPIEVGRSYARAHPTIRWDEVDGAGHLDLIDPLAPAFARVLSALHDSASR